MSFVSTRAPEGQRFSLAEALRLGPAPDGGLLMPERLEPLPASFFTSLPALELPAIAGSVLSHLLGDALESAAIARVVDGLDFSMPLVSIDDRRHVLELFHGPTLAFKDVGARSLARLLAATRKDGEGDEAPTVLVATSGDTGGAVAQAFYGVEGTRVAILYPDGKVSPLQERQFTTLGDNVRAFAVDGSFDDCQRLVKGAFADRELSERLSLTSANSINIGRLLPQVIYYFHAASQLVARRGAGAGSGDVGGLLFVTPSGNFGNLTAGLIARRLGLDARFIAATNANDVVPEYLRTGDYRPRASQRTLSNAMDVGDPNNLERILYLYDHDLDALRRDVSGAAYSDQATREAIASVEREHGYLLDPHTAVGWLALEQALADGAEHGIVLATAHPAKFADLVEPVLGRTVDIPERLAKHLDKPVRSRPLSNDLEALRRELEAFVGSAA